MANASCVTNTECLTAAHQLCKIQTELPGLKSEAKCRSDLKPVFLMASRERLNWFHKEVHLQSKRIRK